MSLSISSTPYANTINVNKAGTERAVNDTSELLKTIKSSSSYYSFDRFESYLGAEYRDFIVKDPDILLHEYVVYFDRGTSMYKIEDSLEFYEKGCEAILKSFENDTELLNAHLQTFDKAFENKLDRIAFHTALSLAFERFEAQVRENQGIKYEGHKLATNKDFDAELFAVNAKILLKEFGLAFLDNVRNGSNYFDAQKNALEFMEKSFKTETVNKLSMSDFMLIGKNMIADKRVLGFKENLEQRSELNRRFNNSSELSAELRALLG